MDLSTPVIMVLVISALIKNPSQIDLTNDFYMYVERNVLVFDHWYLEFFFFA